MPASTSARATPTPTPDPAPPGEAPGAAQQQPAEPPARPGPAARYAAEHGVERLYDVDLARLAGRPGHPLKPNTIARYKALARAARAAGQAGPRDYPAPDGPPMAAPGGGVPLDWYWPATADAWLAVRQQGAGRPPRDGGRPAIRTDLADRAKPGPGPATRPARPSPGRPRRAEPLVTEGDPDRDRPEAP
jgi:hypothetical protein